MNNLPQYYHRGAAFVTPENVSDKVRAFEAYHRKAKGHGRIKEIQKTRSLESLASPYKEAYIEPHINTYSSEINLHRRRSVIDWPLDETYPLWRPKTNINQVGYEASGIDYCKFNAQETCPYKPFRKNGQYQASLQNIAYLSTGSANFLSAAPSVSTEKSTYYSLNNIGVHTQYGKYVSAGNAMTLAEQSKRNGVDEAPIVATEYSPEAGTDNENVATGTENKHVDRAKVASAIKVETRRYESNQSGSTGDNYSHEEQSRVCETLKMYRLPLSENSKAEQRTMMHANRILNNDTQMIAQYHELNQSRSLNVERIKDSTVIFEAPSTHVTQSTDAQSYKSAQSSNYYERKNIIDSTLETLKAFQQDDNKCNNGLDKLVLKRFRNAKRILDNTGLLIIKCAEKDGSSDLGKCLLLAYKDTTQCIVANISEYTTCITGGHGPYSILVDDAFGVSRFEGQQVNTWITNIERDSIKRTSGSLNLIFVLKYKNVSYCQEFLKRYKTSVVDLSDSDNQLGNDEKQYLLERCINRKNSQRKRKKIVLSKQTVECIGKSAVSSGFFEMVDLFLSKKSNTDQGQTFFDKPSDELYSHISGWKESIDVTQKKMYLALAALCLFNGWISNNDIAELSHYDVSNVKKNTKRSFERLNCSRNSKRRNENTYQPQIQIMPYKCLVDLTSTMTFNANIGMLINDGMINLLGTCVQKIGNYYTFANTSIETAISVSIGQQFPEVVIQYSKKSFFQEYVGTDMSFEVHENRCIRMDLRNRDLCFVAFERLRQSLKERDCISFVSHPLMKDARFLSIVSENWDTWYYKIFGFFNKKQTFFEIILNTQDIISGENSLILSLDHPFYEYSSRQACHSLADWVLKQRKWRDIRKENRALSGTVEQKILVRCCTDNLEDVYMSLVKSVCINTSVKQCLNGAIRSGSLNIVEYVLTASKLSTEEYALALEEATACYAHDIRPQRLDILLKLEKYSDKKLLLTSIGKSGNDKLLAVAITLFEIDINKLITADGPLIYLLTLHNHWTLFGVAIDHFSADPNLIFKGHMCVHLAAECSRLRILQILLKENAHLIHEQDELGRTPIHLASMRGHKSCVLFLLQNSAAINATDKSGQTALHKAACLTGTEVTHLLIANGADKNIKDKKNLTAIDVAKRYRNYENVRKMIGGPRIKNEPCQLDHNVLAALFN